MQWKHIIIYHRCRCLAQEGGQIWKEIVKLRSERCIVSESTEREGPSERAWCEVVWKSFMDIGKQMWLEMRRVENLAVDSPGPGR